MAAEPERTAILGANPNSVIQSCRLVNSYFFKNDWLDFFPVELAFSGHESTV